MNTLGLNLFLELKDGQGVKNENIWKNFVDAVRQRNNKAIPSSTVLDFL
jgi:hypothetical protein